MIGAVLAVGVTSAAKMGTSLAIVHLKVELEGVSTVAKTAIFRETALSQHANNPATGQEGVLTVAMMDTCLETVQEEARTGLGAASTVALVVTSLESAHKRGSNALASVLSAEKRGITHVTVLMKEVVTRSQRDTPEAKTKPS